MIDQDAKVRARQVVDKCPFPALTTVDENGFPQVRAMMVIEVEDDFTAYYITARMSDKCKQLAANPHASTFWQDVVDPMSDWRSLLVKGTGEVADDKALRERFWTEDLKQFFPQGVDDPQYVIIVVKPTEMIFADHATMPPEVAKL
jgi:general stress protein 26